jgi:hypothetical protein
MGTAPPPPTRKTQTPPPAKTADGTGKIGLETAIPLAHGVHANDSYLRLIGAHLTDVLLYPIPGKMDSGSSHPIYFTFTEGDGILMPIHELLLRLRALRRLDHGQGPRPQALGLLRVPRPHPPRRCPCGNDHHPPTPYHPRRNPHDHHPARPSVPTTETPTGAPSTAPPSGPRPAPGSRPSPTRRGAARLWRGYSIHAYTAALWDRDNILAASKAYLDGIAGALGANDRDWDLIGDPAIQRTIDRANPRFEITLHPATPTQ